LRTYRYADLRARWRRELGIDPFPAKLSGEGFARQQCRDCRLIFTDPPLHGTAEMYRQLGRAYPWYYEETKWDFDAGAGVLMDVAPKSLLDVGCGRGAFMAMLKPLVERLDGIDLNPTAVEACRAAGLSARCGSIADVAERFDAIVLFHVLGNAPDLGSFVRALVDRLRPGGHLLIAVPNPDGYLAEIPDDLLELPPHHNYAWSERALMELAARFGLSVQRRLVEPLRYEHYLRLRARYLHSHAPAGLVGAVRRVLGGVRVLLGWNERVDGYLRDRGTIVGHTHMVLLRRAAAPAM
jgi:SAM-dependent methyltransferase